MWWNGSLCRIAPWAHSIEGVLQIVVCYYFNFFFRQILYKLLDLGCNPEVKSHDGDTALQIMIKRQRLPCVMALLSRSVDASSVGSEGNNALHLAISVSSRCDWQYLQSVSWTDGFFNGGREGGGRLCIRYEND